MKALASFALNDSWQVVFGSDDDDFGGFFDCAEDNCLRGPRSSWTAKESKSMEIEVQTTFELKFEFQTIIPA